MSDDTVLIHATLGGNVEAYGELVLRYQDRLLRSLAQLIGGREEAEDVAQEAFTQAYLSLSTFQGQSGFYTWLYRIAVNKAISRQRKKRGSCSLESLGEAAMQSLTEREMPVDERLLQTERAAQLQAALAQLAEEYRTILILRDLDDLDYSAIGEILDLPPGTVRSRLHRARLRLREILQEMMKEPSLPRGGEL